MDPHSNGDLEGALGFLGGGIGGTREGGEKASPWVSTSTPTMALEDLAQNKPVLGQVVGVTLAPLLHQPGRALDVREEESDVPARKLPHPLII